MANDQDFPAPQPSKLSSLLTPGRFALLVALAHLPVMVVFAQNLWLKPHYQFFPVLIAAAAWLAWLRFEELPRPLVGGPKLAEFVVGLGLLGAMLGAIKPSPFVTACSLLFSLAGVCWLLGGKSLLKAMAGPLALLILIIPPPGGLDATLVEKMQTLAVNQSSKILDKVKINHSVAGNVVELASRKLLVEEACSGINSLLSVAAFTMCYAVWTRRNFLHALILVGAAIFFVLILNIIRISLGAILEARYQYDILTGWKHEMTGIILFVGCLALVMSVDQLLVFPMDAFRAWRTGLLWGLPVGARLAAEANLESAPKNFSAMENTLRQQALAAAAKVKPTGPPWHASSFSALLAAGFLVTLVLSGLSVAKKYSNDSAKQDDSRYGALLSTDDFELPFELAGWTKIEGEATPVERSQLIGRHSKSWFFTNGRLQAAVSLDFPFNRWHELISCYRSSGWTIDSREIVPDQPFVQSQMTKPQGIQGNLVWGIVKKDGQWLDPENRDLSLAPPEQGFIASLNRWAIEPMKELFQPQDSIETNPLAHYQVQTFLPSYGFGAITDAERQALANLHGGVASMLAKQVRGEKPPAEWKVKPVDNLDAKSEPSSQPADSASTSQDARR